MDHILISIFESFLGTVRGFNSESKQCQFDCPACSAEKGMPEGDGKGNLELNYNKGVFKCWSCQDVNNMSGSILKLIKRYGSQKHVRDYLLLKPDLDEVELKEKEDVILTLPEGYKKLSECTSKDYKSDLAKRYLYKRGITDDIIKEFDIGYTCKGKYFNRIIIPSYDSEGELNYFVARWFEKEKTKLKYLNPNVEKKEIIFNEAKLNLDSTVYIVEGATDHIVIPNSVPLLGKHLTPKLLDLLHENAMAYIVIVLDDDAKSDALNLYRNLNFGDLYNRIKVCFPPEGYDPSLIHEKLGSKGIAKLLMSARKPTNHELDYL